ncbi:hypothetical protein CPB84DRAFT_262416 [Gymnopilus junonius]|uniref:Uncharacterized protein n=1 Tax=Gymnopilus junonius TaxID=109634 RepID=A0A9P5TH91_GYMJU|nr:hypothetical protein CPB84DRAFT_262416 [Gymnopilus junonius]
MERYARLFHEYTRSQKVVPPLNSSSAQPPKDNDNNEWSPPILGFINAFAPAPNPETSAEFPPMSLKKAPQQSCNPAEISCMPTLPSSQASIPGSTHIENPINSRQLSGTLRRAHCTSPSPSFISRAGLCIDRYASVILSVIARYLSWSSRQPTKAKAWG